MSDAAPRDTRAPADHNLADSRAARRPASSWPAVITFDCYGTLVRWPEALRSVFETLVPDPTDAAAFHRDFGEHHVRLKSQPYRPYAQVLSQALTATIEQWRLDTDVALARRRLLEAVSNIAPYDDVVPVLQSLSERYRLAIVSNTDDALIAATVRGLGVDCRVITAGQARAYKPDLALFRHAHATLGVTSEGVLHVAAGWATDMAPAFELNMTRVWIDRRGETGDPQRPPSAVLPDLRGLPDLIPRLREARTDQ